MAREDRICVVCGTHYRFCPYCAEFEDRTKYPLWMMTWDKEGCREISNILAMYDSKGYDIEETADRLSLCDTKVVANSQIKAKINEIMAMKAEIEKSREPEEPAETEKPVATETKKQEFRPQQNKRIYYNNKYNKKY